MSLDGFLLVDKPQEWTSFDVVAKTRGVLSRGSGKRVKIGHSGTLDPLASGLMILMVGNYCKRAAEFSKLDKTYEVTLKLGEVSETGDEEGEKTMLSRMQPDLSAVQATLATFVGESMQVPPQYSAIKVQGQRAYKLARAGKKVEIEPRPVNIAKIELKKYEYPYIEFVADVSSGTYIRSLVSDIGENLTVGAYMTNLRRTRVGNYRLEEVEHSLADFGYEQVCQSLRNL